VELSPESHRGGVLTMASVLKVTANGTTTSPILRGAWVLDRILGTPPPKPTGDVEAVEPDIRGATTIRSQLAKHRQNAECASCHVKIDPPGFALENFDVIGGWRDHYRSIGAGEPVIVDGRKKRYLNGPKVDAADVLPDGRRFQDVDEYKQLLLADKDQLARALTEKLLSYATGAAPTTAEAPPARAAIAPRAARHIVDTIATVIPRLFKGPSVIVTTGTAAPTANDAADAAAACIGRAASSVVRPSSSRACAARASLAINCCATVRASAGSSPRLT